MSKTPNAVSLPLGSPRRNESLFAWLHRELREAILDGRLKPGTLLPPSRTLATQCGVARGTVVGVFEQLISEGYLESRAGSGTRVHAILPDQLFRAAKIPEKKAGPPTRARLAKRAGLMSFSPFPGTGESRPVRAFRSNLPSVVHFPVDLWSRLTAKRMRLASRELLLAGDITGYRPLREAMSAHLGLTRGVVCDPDQIFILSGTQQALDLVARLTLDPGDEAWVEEPGYPGATTIFRAVGANPLPVPVDESGLRVMEGIRSTPRARLAYVTPAHQFPLCVTMSVERRMQLLEWSRQTGAWIFEDDCDSEFRFDGRPLPALQGLDPKGNVVFSGSFSKILFPSLRIGYVVVPPHLVEAMRAARSITDRYGPSLAQAVLNDFITEGHFERLLRRMRGIYAEHLEVLVNASKSHWGERLVVRRTQTGLQTVARLEAGRSAQEFARAAMDVGVEVVPVSRYSICAKSDDKLQLGFAAVSPPELRVGVEAVSRLLRFSSSARNFAKPLDVSDNA